MASGLRSAVNRIVVVGAGPTGLSLALQLARAGQPVTLLEASRDFSRSLRGDALMPCGLEALARMGLWSLLDSLPQRTLRGWSIWIEGKRLFHVAEPAGSLQPCRLVPQQALLEALLTQARAVPGFDWRPGEAVTGLIERDGRIGGVRIGDGQGLPADLVVGCDGRDSSLRQAGGLSLRRRGAPLELLWFQLNAAAIAARVTDPELEGFLTLVGGGAIASACIGATGDLQLGWLLASREVVPQRSVQQWAAELARLAPEPLAQLLHQSAGQLQRPRRFGIQVGLCRRWWRPGLLLLGDAAHPMSPIRAQGINMALRDSLVAAREILNAAAAGSEGGGGLDQACARIEQLRRPEVSRLQGLQLAEARQGQRIGHSGLLRHGLALGAPLLGPLARRVWLERQRPLRQGTAWL
jgi:2-polyprenyl-6-methoxyphenol hydroxylase-like FAD-dependent oxidoreductase